MSSSNAFSPMDVNAKPTAATYRLDSDSASGQQYQSSPSTAFPLNSTAAYIGSPGPATTNPYTTVVQRAESHSACAMYNPPVTVPVAPGSRSQTQAPAQAQSQAYAPAPVDPYQQQSYYSAPPPFQDPYYAQSQPQPQPPPLQQSSYQPYPASYAQPDPYYPQQQHLQHALPAPLPPQRAPSMSVAPSEQSASSRVYKVVPESEAAPTSTASAGMPTFTASNAPFAHLGASAGGSERAAPPSNAGYGTGMLGASPYAKEKRHNACTLCCFGRGFGGCCCCIVLVLFLLIAALLVFLFLIVKVPKVTFGGAKAPVDRPPLQLSGSTVNLNWDFVFKVANPNSFGASVSSLDMRAFPPTAAATADNLIANGTKLDTYIEANGNTDVQFPVTFSLNTRQSSNSQFFAGVLNACGGGGPAGNQISVKYELDIGLAMLKPIGYKYKHEDKASFACPINVAGNPALSAILQLIGGLANSRNGLAKRGNPEGHQEVDMVMATDSGRRRVGRAWISVGPN